MVIWLRESELVLTLVVEEPERLVNHAYGLSVVTTDRLLDNHKVTYCVTRLRDAESKIWLHSLDCKPCNLTRIDLNLESRWNENRWEIEQIEYSVERVQANL